MEIVASNVPCRVNKGDGDLDVIGEQHTLTEWYTLAVPTGTEIKAGYTVTLADGADGLVFQIISLIARRSEAMDVQAQMKREVK